MMSRILGTRKHVNPSWNIFVALIAVLVSSLFQPIDMLAQSGAGSIQGTIQDATSAALPGSRAPRAMSRVESGPQRTQGTHEPITLPTGIVRERQLLPALASQTYPTKIRLY